MKNNFFQEEPLIFEYPVSDNSAVDFDSPLGESERLGGIKRSNPIGLSSLSEPEVVRHYTRLSRQNYSIDTGLYPLGSCTMKHNPRLNEKMVRLKGFMDIHPFQPEKTIQGAYKAINLLSDWLINLTGLPAVAMSPAAGAHGELCGLMCIRAAHEHNGEDRRKVVLVPESAHGTNPASASLCGYSVESIPCNSKGRVDLDALNNRLGDDIAAVMITNPNTCGLFETDALRISDAVHDTGAYFYMDGANFNAIVGRLTLKQLGVDAMHINLHKTFSTPHGGGGPGAGPTVLSESLAPFAPVPFVVKKNKNLFMVEHSGSNQSEFSIGRMKGFHGQFGVFVRALSYIMSLGGDGLSKVSGDAVLNANYLRVRLSKCLTPFHNGICMHEVLFDGSFLDGTGTRTIDFAKAMIDSGFHPPTMYFPLVVQGALLFEPTETESKESIDELIDAVIKLAKKAMKKETPEFFEKSPLNAPRLRLDETLAARKPILRWEPNLLLKAAE